MIMPGAGVLLEQLEAAGLGDIQVIGADSFDATVVWSAGDVANDVSFTAHTFPRDDNGVQEFLDAAEAAGAEIETVSFGALASDVVQGLRRRRPSRPARSTAPTLIETIANLSDLEVTTGTVTYAGTNGVPEKDVVILTVTDGEPAFTEAFQPSFVPGRDTMLVVDGLTARYGAVVALHAVSVTVGEGELVALVGPNGAGKTTLLNTVAGLLRPPAAASGSTAST